MSKNVVIAYIDISTPLEKVKEFEKEDNTLIAGVRHHIENNLDNDVEIFQKINNIAATEKGYFVAAYKSDIEEIDG